MMKFWIKLVKSVMLTCLKCRQNLSSGYRDCVKWFETGAGIRKAILTGRSPTVFRSEIHALIECMDICLTKK